jgi:hypothetical protein
MEPVKYIRTVETATVYQDTDDNVWHVESTFEQFLKEGGIPWEEAEHAKISVNVMDKDVSKAINVANNSISAQMREADGNLITYNKRKEVENVSTNSLENTTA